MVVLHTCELHEVDDYYSALPYPVLSDSCLLDVFTSSFNTPQNRYLMFRKQAGHNTVIFYEVTF